VSIWASNCVPIHTNWLGSIPTL